MLGNKNSFNLSIELFGYKYQKFKNFTALEFHCKEFITGNSKNLCKDVFNSTFVSALFITVKIWILRHIYNGISCNY